MPVFVYLASIAIVGALALLVYAFAGVRSPSRAIRDNLGSSGTTPTDLRQLVLSRPARDRVVAPLTEKLAHGGRRLTPAGMLDRIETRLHLAGLAARWPVERVLAVKLALALLGGFLGIVALATGGSTTAVLLGAAAAAIGFFAPDFLLDKRARSRQDQIALELPDVIDQVTISVEAGLGFSAALAMAARTGGGPFADEIAHVLQDVRLGLPRQAAFEQLLARTDVPDLRQFVVAISQAERHGVPIAQVLRVQSAELRDKRRDRAEERAMKLPVKLVFPLVLCILPARVIVVAGPAVIRLSQTSMFGS